jgi:hypothetical protein
MTAPASLRATDGAFIRIDVSAVEPPHPSWQRPVQVYFKRVGNTWRLIGLERLPEP